MLRQQEWPWRSAQRYSPLGAGTMLAGFMNFEGTPTLESHMIPGAGLVVEYWLRVRDSVRWTTWRDLIFRVTTMAAATTATPSTPPITGPTRELLLVG